MYLCMVNSNYRHMEKLPESNSNRWPRPVQMRGETPRTGFWRFAEAVGASLFLPLAVRSYSYSPEPFKLCSHEGRDSLQPLPVVRGQAYPHQTEQPLHLLSPCQPVLHRPGQRPGHADLSIREDTTYWLYAIPMAAMSSLSAADTTSGPARSMSSIVTSI